jgi:hypothetical protein
MVAKNDLCLAIDVARMKTGEKRAIACLREHGHDGSHVGASPDVLRFLSRYPTIQSIARTLVKYDGALTRLANR